MGYYLAQVNIAKKRAPLESPVMAEFVANLERINSLADNSDGFIWRLKDDGNDATAVKIFGDDFLLVNLSVWRDRDALFQFIYQSDHVGVMKRRKEWFEKMKEMYMALWYIPQGALPTVADAEERLVHLRDHGETPFSFSFKKSFTFEEATSFVPGSRQGEGTV